jgi:ABC-2 type transport system ATP-binding protein
VPEAEIRERTERLLGENDLLDRADELVEAYSHGMKQRLALSAALLHDPRVLIVDEPMVGLDPNGRRRIKARFRDLARAGRTVFLSTHSMDVAEEVCDRVGILYKGRLVALGTVADIRAQQGGAALEEIFLTLTEEEKALSEESRT